jgi:hypothetical protein
MKAYMGAALWCKSILTSALDANDWSTSRSGSFIPEKESSYSFTSGPTAGVNVLEEIKISIFPEFETRGVEPAIQTTPSLLVDVGS